jgi:hypothetical protein
MQIVSCLVPCLVEMRYWLALSLLSTQILRSFSFEINYENLTEYIGGSGPSSYVLSPVALDMRQEETCPVGLRESFCLGTIASKAF